MAVKKEPVAPAPVVSDKKKALETAMQQIEKMYGKGSIMRYGAESTLNVESIPTGSLSLDLRWVSVACPGAVLWRSTDRSPPVRPRWHCTCWPRPRKWAAR